MNASMRNWWPVLKNLDIPMPKTVLMPLEREETIALACMVENEGVIPDELRSRILENADKIGYPLFLRTDQTSCKHSWESTCHVESSTDLLNRINNLIDESSCLGLLGLPTYGLAFREFLEMDSKFTAFDGMPVSPERRYFAEGRKILCHHHYWIQDAIEFRGRPKPDNWEKILAEMNAESKEEIEHLSAFAEEISYYLTKCIGGAWSIDFCKGKDGTWYFIDCAPSELSWHPAHEDEKPEELI